MTNIAPTMLAAAGATPVAAPLPHQRREVVFGRPHRGGAAPRPAMTRRWNCGGFLTMSDDDPAPDETFAEYRTRYREGEQA